MSILGAFAPLHEALDYHQSRHALLTSNLANVDTPGYRPRELYRTDPDFKAIFEIELRKTNTRHMGVGAPQDPKWRVREDVYSPEGPDGNAVSLDREAVKIAANNLRYEAVSAMTAGRLDSYLWAAHDGR